MSSSAQFIQDATAVVGQPSQVLNELPLVPFQTDLKLTREQEKKMIEHAFKRLQTLNTELGRDTTMTPNWWQNSRAGVNAALTSQGLFPYDTFMGKRTRFDATFANDVSWRPYTVGPDSIFYTSNIPVPVVRRVCRQMIAKARNAFYGSDNWFSIMPSPVPEMDMEQYNEERANRIEKFLRFKLGERESDAKASGSRAIRQALILGECAVKTSYVIRDQIFNIESQVLHSVDEGQALPVRDARGNFVTDQDQFEDASDELGNPVKVLSRDKQTQMPIGGFYQKIPLDRRQVLFEGARSEPIYYKDFLCPLTAVGVQEADCVVHLHDEPVFQFVDLIVKRGMVDDTSESRILAGQKMLALIKKLSNNSDQPKSAETMQLRPNENFSSAPLIESGGPVSEFAEFFLWYDANGDGVAENIMLICDRKSQAPIFYDHVANVTTDGLRPIEIVRVNPIEGRWYGLGVMELFESYQTIIDLLVNRWNFSQSRAGRVDFWRPTDTAEGERNPNLVMNFGQTYTAKPGTDPEKILHSVYLNDIKFEQLKDMTAYFQQLLTAEAGVLNANDAESAGLDSSKLATGIISIQQSGEELFDPFLQDLKPGIQGVLDREVDVTLSNINPEEVYRYFDGNAYGLEKITPADVRGLKYKTEITLTSRMDQKELATMQAASALIEKFYMLAPSVQVKVVDQYRRQLRILDPRADVRKTISPVEDTGPVPSTPKVSVGVTLKGEDLSPAQKDELLSEKVDIQSKGGSDSTPAMMQNVGSVEKPGEPGAATEFTAQLSQRLRRRATPGPG
jgi:hypothetical protein